MLLQRFRLSVGRLQQYLSDIFKSSSLLSHRPSSDPFQLALDHAGISQPSIAGSSSSSSFLESLKDRFVWGVPKYRVSLARRKKRWYSNHYMAPYQLRTDIVTCPHCGNWHEAHSICDTCYEQSKKETQEIYDAAKLDERTIRDKELLIVYEGETPKANEADGKQIVQMQKKRPLWFNSALTTKVIEGRKS